MNTSLTTNYTRQTFWLGTTAYLLLVGLAAVFFKERMAVLDMAFQTFQILRTESLQIQSGRFGAAGTQFFAWAAQAVGLPLKGVLLSYSIGHVLYYFICFLLITLGLRQWKWGLLLVLCSTLMTSHTFYWLSEVPQGLAFLLLILAWLDSRESVSAIRWWQFGFLTGALVTAFYFHPLILYPMLFCSVFVLLDQTKRDKKILFLLAAGIFLVAVFVKYKVLKLDWYDAMSLQRAKAFSDLWPHWFDLQSNRDFLQWCLTDYYMIPLLVALNTGFYLLKKNGLKALLALGSPIGFVLLVNIPFHGGDNQFYLENLYLPLAVFVSLPLVFDVLPGLLPQRWQVAPLVILVCIGLVRIYQTHEPWTARVNWEERFIAQTANQKNQKLLLTEEQVPMDTLMLSWGTAYEFLLLSSLKSPDSTRCILVDESAFRFDSLLTKPNLFLGEFKNYNFDQLPSRYFHFRDTTAYVRY